MFMMPVYEYVCTINLLERNSPNPGSSFDSMKKCILWGLPGSSGGIGPGVKCRVRVLGQWKIKEE
ncbi:hypothetical protein RB213_003481 [Colletotrichum asianum]